MQGREKIEVFKEWKGCCSQKETSSGRRELGEAAREVAQEAHEVVEVQSKEGGESCS